MNNAKRICTKYFKQVKQIVLPLSPMKKEGLAHLKDNLNLYAVEHPNMQYNDLISTFGSPDDIAEMMFPDNVSPNVLRVLCLPSKKMMLYSLVIALFIILISMCIILTHSKTIMNHYFEEIHIEQNY